jgi:hypothetical protein
MLGKEVGPKSGPQGMMVAKLDEGMGGKLDTLMESTR